MLMIFFWLLLTDPTPSPDPGPQTIYPDGYVVNIVDNFIDERDCSVTYVSEIVYPGIAEIDTVRGSVNMCGGEVMVQNFKLTTHTEEIFFVNFPSTVKILGTY